jgi:stage III sporulation protein AG
MGGSGLFASSKPTESSLSNHSEAVMHLSEPTLPPSEEDLEAKLLRILSAVEGAGQVQVALNYSESASAEYVQNSDITESNSKETFDTGNATQSTQKTASLKLAEINAAPVKVKEYMPKLSGAVIVAEGANDALVREQLYKAARVLLGLPAHRIVVVKAMNDE